MLFTYLFITVLLIIICFTVRGIVPVLVSVILITAFPPPIIVPLENLQELQKAMFSIFRFSLILLVALLEVVTRDNSNDFRFPLDHTTNPLPMTVTAVSNMAAVTTLLSALRFLANFLSDEIWPRLSFLLARM